MRESLLSSAKQTHSARWVDVFSQSCSHSRWPWSSDNVCIQIFMFYAIYACMCNSMYVWDVPRLTALWRRWVGRWTRAWNPRWTTRPDLAAAVSQSCYYPHQDPYPTTYRTHILEFHIIHYITTSQYASKPTHTFFRPGDEDGRATKSKAFFPFRGRACRPISYVHDMWKHMHIHTYADITNTCSAKISSISWHQLFTCT